MNTKFFTAAILLGCALRAAALLLPGTRDTIVWRVWSYNAAREGVSRLYGVGGSPPERRMLEYAGDEMTVDYPPLALHELGLAGRVYRRLMHGEFPNTAAFVVAVKAPGLVADAGFAVLLYFVVRRTLGTRAARWATCAYWLNPAVILDGAALGYLDPQFILPIGGSLVAACAGWAAVAGALAAVAILTKAQAVILCPAIALAVWHGATPYKRQLVAMGKAAVAGLAVVGVVMAPIVAVGAGPNILQALGRLATHDMLSANACNLWWVVGYVVRSFYSFEDFGVWGAFTHETKILQISRFMQVGFPNPRPIGTVLTLAAIGWAVWRARRAKDLWITAALGAFLVHAYFTLSAQVHENHLAAAVPLLALAAAGRRRFAPILAALTAIVTVNLNLFFGISEYVGYAIPRSLTLFDMTVVVAIANCVALAWHAAVFSRECSAPITWSAAPRIP